MKTKNNALEFWRFLWSVSLGFLHLNVQYFVRGWDIPARPIMVSNGSIAFFFILTGYFMMASFQAKKARGLTANVPASVQSWKYFLQRVKRLLPPTIGGCTVGFIVMCFWKGIDSVGAAFDYLMTEIFEFFGLYEIGMTGFSGFDSVCATVWYISVIMIAGTIIYYLLARNEDSFVGLWAPVLIIVIYALYGTTDHGSDYVGLLPLRLLRAFAGISVGVLLYHPIEAAKKHTFTAAGKLWLTIGNILLSVYTLYVFVYGQNYPIISYGVLQIGWLFILFINQDPLTRLLDNRFSGFLGRLSLYYYVFHFPMIYVTKMLFPSTGYYQILILHFCISMVVALIVMAIDEKFVTPRVNRIGVRKTPQAT